MVSLARTFNFDWLSSRSFWLFCVSAPWICLQIFWSPLWLKIKCHHLPTHLDQWIESIKSFRSSPMCPRTLLHPFRRTRTNCRTTTNCWVTIARSCPRARVGCDRYCHNSYKQFSSGVQNRLGRRFPHMGTERVIYLKCWHAKWHLYQLWEKRAKKRKRANPKYPVPKIK